MNERIKEIEKQCWQSTETDPYALFDVKKFAELIIQDVYQYVDGLDTAQIISNGILKRYGVTV